MALFQLMVEFVSFLSPPHKQEIVWNRHKFKFVHN